MPSSKKIAANRANASKSTGPKTQAGKEASRRNSLVHGLTAEVLFLDHEDPAEFQALRDAFVALYPPTNALDREYVDRLVSIVWRMRRVPVFEGALIGWMKHRQSAVHDAPANETAKSSAKGAKEAPGPLSLADGQLSDVALQRLRAGRALEALLEKNLIGKLDDHEARLTRQLRYVSDWLECQKQARAGFWAHQKTSGAIDVAPLREGPPSTDMPPALPAKDAGSASLSVGGPKGGEPTHSAEWLAEASARGQYVPASLREAMKQQHAQGKGGSANTPG